MKLNGQQLKQIKDLLAKLFVSRLAKFTYIIFIWMVNLELLSLIGFLNKIDGNLLIVVNLAVFFFALTASPTTWVIKGLFGFEAGSNDPKHTHVTFNENSHKGQIDIREYGDKDKTERLIKVSNDLESKS